PILCGRIGGRHSSAPPHWLSDVCGEQRWRAARAAGMAEVLVRVHPPLRYLERLEKQREENRLRSDLDPVEEAHCITVTWNKAPRHLRRQVWPSGGGNSALRDSRSSVIEAHCCKQRSNPV